MDKSNSRSKKEENQISKVDIANSVSILDYAYKNNIEVLYEDQNVARIADTETSVITVYKENNSWKTDSEEEENNYGNTIRFVAKVENTDWKEAMSILLEERAEYLSAEEYNRAYLEELNEQNQEDREVSSDRMARNNQEFRVVKEIPIVEYLKVLGLPVKELHSGKFAVIADKRYEGLIIYNQTNTWDWNTQGIRNEDIIGLAMKVQGYNRQEALEEMIAFTEDRQIIPNKLFAENILEPDLNAEEESSPIEAGTGENTATVNGAQEVYSEAVPEITAEKQAKKKTMSKEQLSEILSGYRWGIDVSEYDNPDLNPEQMHQLKLAISRGINAGEINSPRLSAEYMKEMRLALQNGISLEVFKDKNNQFIFSTEQAREIRLGYINGLTAEAVAIYAYSNLDHEVMKELRLGLQNDMYEMKNLSSGNYTAKDIHAIRMTLTINRILDSIKLHLRNLYYSIISLLERNIVYERENKGIHTETADIGAKYQDGSDTIDTEKEAVYELKDAIEEIYYSMEEELQDLPIDQKKEAIVDALWEVLHKAREMDDTVAAQNHSEVYKAVDELIEEKEMEHLQEAAYESLQEEYVEQFFDNENKYNEMLIEFTSKILSDSSIENGQKTKIFERTLGIVYGSKVAEKWIEHLPVEQQNSPVTEKQLQMIREEYEQMITVTEELVHEAG
ncbi:hypothetical protein [Anaerocolumna sp. MB42-C2]|uniref:hypothetical protein n=1 Tax=Anaerocolumna sp. MB42-C2 TaxID=3070997 RepID=UPI0027E15033|nr:hypothetical protein [Anaerocolumna sp. MB42-C2]WMJ88528.1 hypothetical protein RBU59_03160 [Anaerocolumna sp. MB42-C2]